MRILIAAILLISIILNESVIYASLASKVDCIAMDMQKESKSENEQQESIDEEVKIPVRLNRFEVLSEDYQLDVISSSYYLKIYAQPILDIHSPPPDGTFGV